ncbi:toll/interleukin-1 receptor domain-containing protein [Streptomyces sp. NPDC006372]|uniref:toll/interleukin-1 receptor domain-containing protein n=1 Tax=Streptomyces sp. NPDC006372 TaxID=3155599 RepID=UPI0033AC8720
MVFGDPPAAPGFFPFFPRSRAERGDEPDAPEPGAHQPVGILREELARLLDTGDAPDAEDALDVLWIARLAGLDPVDWSLLGDGRDPTTAPPPAEPAPPVAPDDHSTPNTTPDPSSARLHLPGPGTGTPARPGGAHAIRVTQPKALPGTLALTRALRPMRQRVASNRARTLDVDATAAASGDTGLLLPVLRPATERRFSVDLLIDTGTTMAVWHRMADELRTLLARHGAFADVRAWALRTDGPEPMLAPFRRGAPTATPTRRWRQTLTDPSGRRVVLVLTDGVGPSWYGTELPAALAAWSRHRPVAVLQVLPSRLWHRTALRTAPVRARATEAAHATLDVRSSGPLPGIARGSAGTSDRARIRWLPVLEVSGDWLHPWARLVSGRTTDWVALRAAPLTVVERPAPVNPAAEPTTPSAWIERFEEGYSPDASRLLHLLAAAPLSLPVMRLIQRTMLPSSTPMHLAELFLSGGLVRRTPAGADEDPDNVMYDFRPGVREALLDRLTRTESLRVLDEVIDAVSARVTETFGGVTDFAALMAAVGEGGGLDGVELPEGDRAFAEVAIAVIGGAGGDYERVAAKVARGRAEAAPVPHRLPEEREEGEKRGWRGWPLLRRLGERRGSSTLGAGDDNDTESPLAGSAVPSRVPALPTPYIRRDEVADVVHVLRDNGTTCVIEGARGVGKTVLAADCAALLASRSTMVRWIRADNRELLLGQLLRFAGDLGLDRGRRSPDTLLSHLYDHLRDHPGWLLVYDGVTQHTFVPDPYDPDSPKLWLPPPRSGKLLVTLSEGRWPSYSRHETVTLGDMARGEALAYLREVVAEVGGETRIARAELLDLIGTMGTRPSLLAHLALRLRSGHEESFSDFFRKALELHPERESFLRAPVWISRDGRFIGTGVVVGPDIVLTTGFETRSTGLWVHDRSGSTVRVADSTVRGDTPGLIAMRLEAPLFPPVTFSSLESRTTVAAWYEPPMGSQPPAIALSPASSEAPAPPPGAALLDAEGRLSSMALPYGSGTVRAYVPALIDGFLAHLPAARDTEGRDRRPRLSQELLVYLSCARPSSPEESGAVRQLITALADDLDQLMPLAGTSITAFVDEDGLPPGGAWLERRYTALAKARIFVPLHSPEYFTDHWSRQEWNLFTWRLQVLSGEGHKKAAIVPVLWTPTDPAQLPPEAADIQYVTLGDRHAGLGLKHLLEAGPEKEYRRVVRHLALTIARAAEAFDGT